jgi:glycerol-3-phosphate dehydrogenase (NAD(P)+)
MRKVAVIGSGAWGTALATHAARMGNAVTMWSHEADVASDISTLHQNKRFLPGIDLPPEITATTDMAGALLGADLVIMVPPSVYLRQISRDAAPHIGKDALVLVATKGFEESSLSLMSTVLTETLPDVGWNRLSFISGPNFAKEVAQGLPTDAVCASKDEASAKAVQEILHAPNFRVYTSTDPIGVQVGGAVKNVLAIAAGACDGLGVGANARAALLTRGLSEMARLGVALGADPLTFIGMSGVGDLILTSTGDLSRNRQLGMKVAKGVDPKAYLATQVTVAEGFYTAHAAHSLAKKHGVEMPITEQVYMVLHEGRSLFEAMTILMTREQREELYGLR